MRPTAGLARAARRETEDAPLLAAVVRALDDARAAGRIRHFGVCNFGTRDLAALRVAGGAPATNQICYNLLWRSCERGIVPAGSAAGVGVLCYLPLQASRCPLRRRAPGTSRPPSTAGGVSRVFGSRGRGVMSALPARTSSAVIRTKKAAFQQWFGKHL